MSYAEELMAWQARAPQTRVAQVLNREAYESGEVRDPKAATQSLTYITPGTKQIPEWDANSAIREAYLSSVLVYACIRTRANAFAGCPLRAVLPGRDIADHDANAPLARLLGPAPNGPNKHMSSRRLWANAIANYIVTGKFAWEMEMPDGVRPGSGDWAPIGLWPLIARSFHAIPTDGGNELFSAFKYGRGGEEYTFKPDQIFYTYDPSLNDVRQASSPLQPLRYEITADVLQSIYDVAFLRNDARPAGIIVHEAFEEASERRSFRQQFDAEFRGPQNANRMAFAEVEGQATGSKGSIDFVQIGLSQRDSMSLLAHKDKAMRICMGLGVPMSLLDASGRTFANAGMEERNFWLDTMLPDLADKEDEINLKLAPRLGPHLAKFDTRHVESLKAPAKFASISVGDAVDRNIIDADEARTEMGYPERDPSDTDLAKPGPTMQEQAAMITALAAAGWDVETIADVVGIEPPAATPEDVDASTAEPVDLSLTMSAGMALWRSLRDAQGRKERRAALWHQVDAQTRSQEGAWERAIRRLFARQKQTVLKRLEARAGRWAKAVQTRQGDEPPEDINPDDVFDPAYWTGETEAAVIGLYDSLYAMAGARVAASVGSPFDITDPRVQQAISYRASQLAQRVSETTYDAIRSVILNGIQAGSSIPEIASGIEAVFEEASRTRATLIARTETIAASADGSLAAYDQARDAGFLDGYGKVWIAELDDRTDAECEGLDGETVGFDESFSSGDDAPPAHPDCRCAIGAEPLERSAFALTAAQASLLLRAVATGTISTNALEGVA